MVELGETVESMQMRFIYIINNLENLGKTLSNQDYANKVVSSMYKKWQPKVTTIKESHGFKALDVYTLFGKLTEHDLELKKLKVNKVNVKKKKEVIKDKINISLKTPTSKAKVEEVYESTNEDSSKEQ